MYNLYWSSGEVKYFLKCTVEKKKNYTIISPIFTGQCIYMCTPRDVRKSAQFHHKKPYCMKSSRGMEHEPACSTMVLIVLVYH